MPAKLAKELDFHLALLRLDTVTGIEIARGLFILCKMKLEEILEITLTSPALKWQSDKGGRFDYPANFRGRVPLKVKTAKKVLPDIPMLKAISKPGTECLKNGEYYVWVNSYGAVTALLQNGERLGLLPSEFDVIEWHNPLNT